MAPITDVLTITIDHFILSFKSRTPLPIIFLGDFVAFFFFFPEQVSQDLVSSRSKELFLFRSYDQRTSSLRQVESCQLCAKYTFTF